MKLYSEMITIANLDCIPIFIYTKQGSPIKAYGVENSRIFSTIYFLPVKEYDDCYVFRLLYPVEFCEQLFWKQTKTTLTVDKDCIIGVYLLHGGIVANEVIYHHDFQSCIKGEYHIAKEFQEAVIWQSNAKSCRGKIKLDYNKGHEKFLIVKVIYNSRVINSYKLYKNDSIAIDLRNAHSLKLTKQNMESKVSGHYLIELYVDMTQRLKL